MEPPNPSIDKLTPLMQHIIINITANNIESYEQERRQTLLFHQQFLRLWGANVQWWKGFTFTEYRDILIPHITSIFGKLALWAT